MHRIRGWLIAASLILMVVATAAIASMKSVAAQGFTYTPQPPRPARPKAANDGQMLVQAVEVDYDYNNNRVAAVGDCEGVLVERQSAVP